MEWVAVGLFGFIAWAAVRSTPRALPSEEELAAEPPNKNAIDTTPLSAQPTGESMEVFGSVPDE